MSQPALHDGLNDGVDDRAVILAEFEQLGITIKNPDNWTTSELASTLNGVQRLLHAANWSIADFKFAMGIALGTRLYFERVRRADQYAAETIVIPDPSAANGVGVVVTFYNGAFADTIARRQRNSPGVVTVHELAHVWDINSGCVLSAGLYKATGGYYDFPFVPGGKYHPGGTAPSGYAGTDQFEDFAESVAAALFPESKRFQNLSYPFYDSATGGGYWQRVTYVGNLFSATSWAASAYYSVFPPHR